MRARPLYPVTELPRRRRRFGPFGWTCLACGAFWLAAVMLWIGSGR